MVVISLHFDNGKAQEALDFYSNIFNYKVLPAEVARYSHMDPNAPEPNWIAYSEIIVFGNRIMISDCPPDRQEGSFSGFSICIALKDKEEITKLYNAFKEDGVVLFELSETMWAEVYGMVKDKFGLAWQFILER